MSSYDIATIYAGLGDEEQTLVWLEKAYQDRSGWLALWLKVDPKFDALRSTPRFQNLYETWGFPANLKRAYRRPSGQSF